MICVFDWLLKAVTLYGYRSILKKIKCIELYTILYNKKIKNIEKNRKYIIFYQRSIIINFRKAV